MIKRIIWGILDTLNFVGSSKSWSSTRLFAAFKIWVLVFGSKALVEKSGKVGNWAQEIPRCMALVLQEGFRVPHVGSVVWVLREHWLMSA